MARQRRGGWRVRTQGLRRRIERWREAGRPGKRMPEELWGAAKALAHEHGAYRIARELGLNYQGLKQRTQEGTATRPRDRGKARGAEFVEIDIGQTVARGVGDASEIEVVRGDGARLRIRLGARERLDVEAVAAAFVGSTR